jgi:hypothetical protein
MIMEKSAPLNFLDIILIMAYPSWVPVVYTIGDSLSPGVDHGGRDQLNAGLARLPTSPMVSREENTRCKVHT